MLSSSRLQIKEPCSLLFCPLKAIRFHMILVPLNAPRIFPAAHTLFKSYSLGHPKCKHTKGSNEKKKKNKKSDFHKEVATRKQPGPDQLRILSILVTIFKLQKAYPVLEAPPKLNLRFSIQYYCSCTTHIAPQLPISYQFEIHHTLAEIKRQLRLLRAFFFLLYVKLNHHFRLNTCSSEVQTYCLQCHLVAEEFVEPEL